MRKLLLGVGVGTTTCFVLITFLPAQTAKPSVEEYPAPLVRERQHVLIRGANEIWELRWKATPAPACEPNDVSLTCPCTGFAYGEGGDLSLVRIRNQREIDRLVLTPFFEHADVNLGGIAILQRWEPDYKTDFTASERADFIDVVSRRPVVKIMNFIDYDHDGERSEFYLKTDTLPCGKSVGLIVEFPDPTRNCMFLEVFQSPPNHSCSKSTFGKR